MRVSRTWDVHGQGGGLGQDVQIGNLLMDNNQVQVNNSATGVTLPATQLTGGHILRTGAAGGAISDTFDTAANLAAQLDSDPNGGTQQFMRIGEAFEFTYANNVGQAITLLTATGLTLQGNATVAAGTSRTIHVLRTGAATFTVTVL